MGEPTRRTVLLTAAAAACACAGCPLLASAAARSGGTVDIGPLDDFARPGVADRWAASDGFFVVSRAGRVYAVASHCTHKKVALVVANGDDGFKCPRHGSTFAADGSVVKAPARKALPRFGIRVNGAGRLVVDPQKKFGKKDWDAPGSYVAAARRDRPAVD